MRNHLPNIAIFVLTFFVVQLCSDGLAQESLAGKRPNIILVMTDDQGMGDLSCMGNQVLRTPNLDSLFKQSTRFTDFHVSPTCAPSRSSIFSGRHEFRNGVTRAAAVNNSIPSGMFDFIEANA